MAIPRHLLVSQDSPSFQHVMCRCVRRAWLCGRDAVSGRSFEHRREWMRQKILRLSQLFAVDTFAYAVMSNHYHIVLYVDPQRPMAWTDEEVVRRWLMVCPPRWIKHRPPEEIEGHPVFQSHVQALLAQPEQIALFRKRLGNLGWFMRFINEYVARRANTEDEVTGRFWEARYRSQSLLDEAAVLTCMAYVDLNPLRAGEADRPEASQYASIRARIEARMHELVSREEATKRSLQPVATSLSTPSGSFRAVQEDEYLELVDWVGRTIQKETIATIPAHIAPILERVGLRDEAWPRYVRSFEERFKLAAGHWQQLKAFAQALGRKWLQGAANSRLMYRVS